jgi:class 3 adenylate cyclase
MKKQLQKFNQNRKQNELFEIENGVGISTGEIYSGSLGVAGNMEFVLSGDKIELASNLEATSKFSKHLNIVVSKEVKQKVGETFIFGDLKSSEIGVCYDLVGKNNE